MPDEDVEGLVPGWYRDPDHAERHRYWNGVEWLSEEEHARLMTDDEA